MPDWLKDLVAILQALLTPAIAIFAVWIARQQWRTANQQWHTAEMKRRQDLFDKRYEFYKAIDRFVGSGISYNKADDHEIQQLLLSHRFGNAYFLFGQDIEDYLDELWKKRVMRAQCANDIEQSRINKASTERFANEDAELHKYFVEQRKTVLKEKFAKYLKIESDSLLRSDMDSRLRGNDGV